MGEPLSERLVPTGVTSTRAPSKKNQITSPTVHFKIDLGRHQPRTRLLIIAK